MNASVYTFAAAAGLFWLALFVGRLIFQWHLPRVTGYLLVGLAAGPSLSHLLGYPTLLDYRDLERLEPVSHIALTLIMLAIGMHFRSEHLRRWRHRIAVLSFSEIGATFFLVFIATATTHYFFGKTQETSPLHIGLFLGIIAIATAPAATLLVIREYDSAGPVTDVITTLIGLNNLVCVLFFNVALYALLTPAAGIDALAISLVLPLLIGAVAGFLMSVWAERLRASSEQQLLMLGGAIGVTAICDLLHVDALLGTFTCGAVLANASTRDGELLASIRQLDYPLYVLFFALAGANLHIEMLGQIGLVGVAYVLLRTAGKLVGCRLGARWGNFGERHEQWTGPAMLSQAGVAIGLSSILAEAWPGPGQMLQTVVLGAVVLFELGGPVAVRIGLVQAGEVPVLTLLARKAPVGTFESLHHVVTHFRQSLGVPQGHRVDHAGDILVEHVMRKSVDTIHTDTKFNELLHLIAHSRYDRFPVVDAEERFVGVIAYEDVRDMLFDPYLVNLVIAADLVRPLQTVARPQQTLSEILKIFREHPDISYLPVLDEADHGHLLGILSQNDVLAAFRRL
ncbi:MAG: Kef-type K+ transport system membrane component KefB/CBS domain-containing protein [Planctomycetota bacterium]|jgi:Kef-type K+ transport system membrane component KefB/CBS domain-containing protein